MSTAVVDGPDAYAEIKNGARRSRPRSSRRCSEAPLPLARRRLRRFRGVAAARRRGGLLRRGRSRPEPAWRPGRTRLGGPAAAARHRGGAVGSSRRTSARPSTSSGRKPRDEEDFLMALDAIAEGGARNVHITLESGCYALFRDDRQVKRFKGGRPSSTRPVSVVGAGDVLLAQFIAAQLDGEVGGGDALRLAVAAGAASTLEVGAGTGFDPRDAGRLVAGIELAELAPVPQQGRSRGPRRAKGFASPRITPMSGVCDRRTTDARRPAAAGDSTSRGCGRSRCSWWSPSTPGCRFPAGSSASTCSS